jgi:hypothetical protein
MYSLNVTPLPGEPASYAFEFYEDAECKTSIGHVNVGVGGQCINEGSGDPANAATRGFKSFTITTILTDATGE